MYVSTRLALAVLSLLFLCPFATITGQGTDPYQINFQDAATTPPDGYLKDFGEAYGPREGQLEYGWIQLSDGTPLDITTPSSGSGRNRAITGVELLQNTLIHMQGNDVSSWTGNRSIEAAWEIAVPDGWYQVDVSVGDPTQDGQLSETPDHFIRVEGVTAIPVYDVDSSLPVGDPGRFTSGSAVVEVSDGKLTIDADSPAANNTKINYAVVTPTTAPVVGCSPISLLPCKEIGVALPFALTFDGTEGGLESTGFTMVDPPSVNQFPANPAYANVPGLEPSRLNVSGGQLTISSAKGINFSQPGQSSETNNQVNGLGVGFELPTTPFDITTRLAQPNFGSSAGNKFQQGYSWFGLDEDRYVKLAVAKTGSSTQKIQLFLEYPDPAEPGNVALEELNSANFSTNNATLDLRMEIDPTTGRISAFYAIDGGTEVLLSEGGVDFLTLPAALLVGIDHDGNAATPALTYAGVMTSHRRADEAQSMDFVFDNFMITPIMTNAPPAIADQSFSVFEDATAGTEIATLSASDADADDVLSYTLTTGNEAGTFALDATTAVLTLTGTLDFEQLTAYTLGVEVTDGEATDAATLTVTVEDVNEAPTARLSTDASSGEAPLTVNFSSAGSSDPEAGNLAFAWDFGDGSTSDLENPAHTYTADGTYTASLMVNDTGGLSSTAATTEIVVLTGNTAPALAAIGDLSATETQTTTVTLRATDVDAEDVLSFSTSTLPAFATFLDNGDGTATLTLSPTTGAAGTYPGITFTVSDGTAIDEATASIVVEPAPAVPCNPISLLPCDALAVSLPFTLAFTGSEAGLADADGELTGFTMVDNHSAERLAQDGAPTFLDVNGYEPSQLDVDGGNLLIRANKGIAYLDPPESSNNNNQLNTLGVGLRDLTQPFSIETQLLGITTGGGAAQAGIWFGIDEDNFVKLNVGTDQVELRSEVGGLSTNNIDELQLKSAGVEGQNVILRLYIDPMARTMEAFYRVNGGAEVQVTDAGASFLPLPQVFLDGRTVDAAIAPPSFAGTYATYRNGSTFDATFDYFSITPVIEVNEPPVVADQSFDVAEDATAGTLVGNVVADDVDSESLAYSFTKGNEAGVFTINTSTGAIRLVGSLDFDLTPLYTLSVRVSDGEAADTAAVAVNVTDVAEPEVACTPISTLPCDEIRVQLPFGLSFDGSETGVAGTGFTMVDPPSVNQFPATPSNPDVPGLEADLLAVAGGKLTITSTKGINYELPPASSENNSQVNALGVGIRVPSQVFDVTVELDQPDFAGSAGNNSQQGGLWFGLDEDNFVKLVVIKDGGQQRVQFNLERNDPQDAAAVVVTEINGTPFPTNAGTIRLRLEVNPTSRLASAYYSIDGGMEVKLIQDGLDAHALPQKLLTGTDHDTDASTASLTYAGVFTTHRRAAENASIDFAFDNFTIRANDITPVLSFAPNELAATVREGSTVPDQVATLSSSDGSAPALTLSDDPESADWLILPEDPRVGQLFFGVQQDLAVGDYRTTIFATAEGYVTAQLEISVTVTADQPIISLNPRRLILDDVAGGAAGRDTTILVANTGNVALSAPTATLSGAGAASFNVDASALPASIPAGGSAALIVNFDPTGEGVQLATLTVSGTNAGDPATVALRGLGKDGNGGSSEPSLQYIFDTYGLPINVGDGDATTNLIEPSGGRGYNDLLGDEIAAQRFERATADRVSLEVLSVYGPESANPIVAFGWYESGVPTATNEVFTVKNTTPGNGQTLNPAIAESLSFDPGSTTFGFYSRWPFFNNRVLYSEDDLNTFTGAIPHHVRVYALPGEENAYVLATEEHVSGFDYQDIVVIVRNVKVAIDEPVATTLRVNFSDQATTAPAGYLQDYGQAFTDRGAQAYGWVVPGTDTPLSLVGNGRNRLPNPDVNILSETLMHMQYGDTGGDKGPTDEGAWEIEIANGTYRVTVNAGDPDDEGVEGTRYVIDAEGSNVIDELATLDAANTFTGTAVVSVTDGRLTLDASGGLNTKITSVVIAPSDAAPQAFFSDANPEDGAINVPVNGFQIAVSVNTPAGFELDETTLTDNVKLFEQTAQGPVELPVNFNDTGGGDAVILTPLSKLKNSTSYLFQLSNVEANRIGDLGDRITFQTFNSNFTTASEDDTNAPADLAGVSFTQVQGAALGEGVADRFSSLVMGPDGKLYASTTGEVIKRWTPAPDGTLTNLEELTIDLEGANHPETGVALGDDRLIIGLTFAPEATADNLVAYITHSALTLSDGPEWDGMLTRLSGPNLQTVEDILTHLPRSKKDHLTNSVIVGPEDDLYIIQGSNSAGGDPDASWGFRPERLLAAALLRVEVDKLPGQLPLSVYTTDDIAVINAAPATGLTMSNGTYNPYSADSPVTLYATGVRNAYDVVFHTNGWMYMPTNGTAGNNKTSPVTPASADYVSVDPSGLGVRRPNGTFFVDPGIPQVFGGETQKDWLFKTKGGSYHGHPNPYRGEFVLNHGGKPYSDLPGQNRADYRDVKKYPIDLGPDANYLEVAYDFDFNKSPNGAIEYRSNAFGGKLQGMLMVVRFSGQDDILVMQPGNNSGDVIQAFQDVPGLQGLDDPLDVVEDPRTGNLYVSQYDRDGNVNQQLILMRADQPALPEAVIAARPDELIFETTVNNEGAQTDTKTVTVTNEGSSELVISSVTLTGPFADQFSFDGPSQLTLAPAAAQTYTVTYAPVLDNSDLGYQEAALTFASNSGDGDEPLSVGLHALKKAGYEGGQEPAFQDVVNTLGIGIDVGWTSLTSPTSPQAVGEEVLVPLFEAAGPGNVGITAVARYSPAETLPFGWYTNIGGTIELNEVAVQAGGIAQAQTLFPGLLSGTQSFDPQGAFFGLYVESNTFRRINYTEDDLNTGGVQHRTRIYPVKDRAGKLVPNSYLVGFEDATNGDYQDYVYVLTNVKPYEAGAQVLSFNPNKLTIPVQRGEHSDFRSSVLSASSALGANQVTLQADEPWVVLPDEVVLGTPLQFAVNSVGLPNGINTATVTATAPGFAPATLTITAEVREEVVYFAQINFQDDSFTPPAGYTADTGEAYGTRASGQFFGWIDPTTKAPQDNQDQARGAARGVTNASSDDDKLLRSLNMFNRINASPAVPRHWEIAVPNGTYLVELAAGDPDFYDSRHTIRAEGVTIIDDFVPSAADYFRTGSDTVRVLDGKLTLDDVGAAIDGNSKIIYVNLAAIDTEDPLPTVAVDIDGVQDGRGNYRGSVTVTLTATDNANSGGIQSLRYSLDGRAFFDYTEPLELSLPPGFTIFDYNLRYEATDANDNVGSGSESFTLVEPSGALVRVENMTKVPGTDRGFPADDFLTFHRLGNSINKEGDSLHVHDRNVLRIHNDGSAPLVINALTTTDASEFVVLEPVIPAEGLTVVPGAFADATVVFVSSGGSLNRLVTEELQLLTNADNSLDDPITLRGAYMRAPEGGNEIDAQQIFRAFGFTTEMGRNANGEIVVRPSSDFPSDERVNSGREGDMILSDFFVQADPGKPLSMIQLSALHGPGGAPTELRLANGSVAGGMKYNHGGLYHQTLIPKSSNTSGLPAGDFVATLSQPFEIMVAGHRTSGGTSSDTRKDELLGVRVYRAIDRDGNVIPNEYIVNQDYIAGGCGEGSANCDWNDNTSYIINARPVAVPTVSDLADQIALVLEEQQYTVIDSFDRGYAGNRLTLSATLSDGSTLPDWVTFEATTGTFTILAPIEATDEVLDITVTATDYNLLTASADFTLTVDDSNIDCTVEANNDGTAKELTCDAGSVQLSGFTSTGSYQWSGPDGFTSDEQNLVVSAPGVYTLATTATGPVACPKTSTVTVSENLVAGNAGNDGSLTACSADATIDLFTQLQQFGGGPETGGTWTLEGVVVSEQLDPATASAGVYVYSVGGTESCAPDMAELTVTIDQALTYYLDADGDGFGDATTGLAACVPPAGYVTDATDCDDAESSVYPGAPEVCDGLDNDCNGQIDDSFLCTDGPVAVRINAGGPEVTYQGETFAADASFLGGKSYENTAAAVPGLYQTERSASGPASFGYSVPVPNGEYLVRLHFAEIYWGATGGEAAGTGQRIFDVTLEDGLVLDDLDLNAEVGAETVNVREYRVTITDGRVDLFFDASPAVGGVNEPKLSGLEIITRQNVPPTAVATATPIDGVSPLVVTLDGSQSTDSDGTVISYDWTWSGGTATGPAPEATFTTGSYVVTLTVTDNEGATATDVVNVDVAAPQDTDQDGVSDTDDNCPTVFNPSQELTTFYADTDGDGFGDLNSTLEACEAPDGYVTDATDCDDTAAGINTGATEICDGVDNDCDGQIDEGLNCNPDGPLAIRINAGGPAVTYQGETFAADASFNGGKSYENTAATVPSLYQTERSADAPFNFSYGVAVPNGVYRVRLHFAEIYFGAAGGGTGGAGKRIFDVTLEDALVLDNFDINAEVGSQTATIREFEVTVTDGQIDLLLDASAGVGGVDQPKLSALEIITQQPTTDQTAFWLEAECAEVGGAWTTVDATDASNGQYVTVLSGNAYGGPPADVPTNRVRFTVEATAGVYQLYARVNAPSGLDDSYYFRVNGGAWYTWNGSFDRGPGFAWNQLPADAPVLVQGSNTIDFAFREDGTQLDKVYLTRGSEVPSGFGQDASNCEDVVVPNVAPVAVASATPTSGTAPLEVRFDATGSSDSDGNIVSYSWAWNDGMATGLSPQATFSAGSYAVTLTVTDDDGATDTDVVNLQVSEPVVDTDNDGVPDSDDNCPTVFNPDQELTTYYADADGDGFGDAGTTLSACELPVGYVTNATDCDDNNGATNPAATEICDGLDNDCNGQIDEGLNCTPGKPTAFWLEAECAEVGSKWSVLTSGQASEGKFAVVQSGNFYNEPPADIPANRIRFTVDAAAGSYQLFARVRAASAADDSYWVRVNGNAWYKWNGTIKTGVGFSWNKLPTTLPNLVAGVNTIDFAFREDGTQLDKVYLTTGNEVPSSLGQQASNCESVVVPNQPPVARATATPTSGVAPLSVSLDGGASTDTDGTIVSYAWTWNGGSATGVSPQATFSTGTYAVTLTVTDDEGATATDVVSITATEPVTNPAVSAFWLEAECAQVGSAWTVQNDGNASEGRFAVVLNGRSTSTPPTDVPTNRIRFTLDNARAGNYHLFGLIGAPSNRNDSYWVRANGGEWINWNSGIRQGTGFGWNKLSRALIPLVAGANTIDFAFREDGTKLDKVHLNLTGQRPSGTGLPSSNCAPTTDSDGDGIDDSFDNCPTVANPNQQLPTYYADFDGDGFGDPNDFVRQCEQPLDYVTNALDNCPAINSPDLTDSDGDGKGDVCDANDEVATSYWLEAECANVGSDWQTRSAMDASNGRFVAFTGGRNNAAPVTDIPAEQVNFTVNVTTASTYHVYLRMQARNAGENSFWVRVDGGSWIKMWKTVGGGDLLTSGFEWRKLNDDGTDLSFNLSSGQHTITVANREPGTRLDKLSLTPTNVAPTDTGEASSNCGSAAIAGRSNSQAVRTPAVTETELTLFPNPTVDELTVDLGSDYSGTVVLRIVDMNGRQLRELTYDKEGTDLRSRLNVADLPSGIYRLHVIEGDRLTLRPFIKM